MAMKIAMLEGYRGTLADVAPPESVQPLLNAVVSALRDAIARVGTGQSGYDTSTEFTVDTLAEARARVLAGSMTVKDWLSTAQSITDKIRAQGVDATAAQQAVDVARKELVPSVVPWGWLIFGGACIAAAMWWPQITGSFSGVRFSTSRRSPRR